MQSEIIMELMCKNGKPSLLTSHDLYITLSNFVHGLSRDYQSNRFDLLPDNLKKRVSKNLHSHICEAVQLIDKTIVDCKNGICALSQGTTNEYLPKYLFDFKQDALKLKNNISKNIQNVKREVAYQVSPVVNCLERYSALEDGIFENLLALTKNTVPQINQVPEMLTGTEQFLYRFDDKKKEGSIEIKDYAPVIISGRRALAFNYLYQNRYKDQDYDYRDINDYLDDFADIKKLDSNTFRLDMVHINKTIKKITKGSMEIIGKREEQIGNRVIKNRYKIKLF